MINCVSKGCPLPQYIKDGGGGGRPSQLVRPRYGVLLGLQVLVGVHQKGRKGEGIGGEGEVAGPLFPSPIRTRGEGGRSSLFLFPLKPIKAHYFSRNPVTPRYLRKYPNHSEPFRCPNIVVQYIDLYVSTISRLLVMSPISSGTPNSFGTSKLINSSYNCHRNLKRADPTVREQCRHDRDTSPVNNQ